MAKNGRFLDVNRLSERFTGSNLATRGLNTPVGVAKVLYWPGRSYFTLKSLPGCPKSNGFGPKWPFSGFLRPLEASRSKIM